MKNVFEYSDGNQKFNGRKRNVYLITTLSRSSELLTIEWNFILHWFFYNSILGSPAYDSVRSLSYQEADVFLICYKISDPISLYNVKNKWIGEIR